MNYLSKRHFEGKLRAALKRPRPPGLGAKRTYLNSFKIFDDVASLFKAESSSHSNQHKKKSPGDHQCQGFHNFFISQFLDIFLTVMPPDSKLPEFPDFSWLSSKTSTEVFLIKLRQFLLNTACEIP